MKQLSEWQRERVAAIKKQSAKQYGAGWAYLSRDQKDAIYAREVLYIVSAQSSTSPNYHSTFADIMDIYHALSATLDVAS